MSKIVFLHIGNFKTGSSALQEFFNENAEHFLRHGLLYPKAGKLHTDGGPWPRHMLLSHKMHHFPEMLKELADEIWRSRASKALVSSETFAGYACNDKRKQSIPLLATALRDFQVRIVIYLRPQEDFLQSFYNWRIKEGNESRKFAEYVEWAFTERRQLFDYKDLLDPWANSFGQENIIVRRYGKPYFHGGDIFRDFLTAINEKMMTDYRLPQKLVNTALSPKVLELVRLLNAGTGKLEERHAFIQLASKVLDGPDCIGQNSHNMLDRDTCIAIRARFFSSNAEVARRYLGNTDGVLFHPSDKLPVDSSPVQQELAHEDMGKLMEELWRQLIGAVWERSRAEQSQLAALNMLKSLKSDIRDSCSRP